MFLLLLQIVAAAESILVEPTTTAVSYPTSQADAPQSDSSIKDTLTSDGFVGAAALVGAAGLGAMAIARNRRNKAQENPKLTLPGVVNRQQQYQNKRRWSWLRFRT